MSPTRAFPAIAALTLLPGLMAVGCRGGGVEPQRTADATRPQESPRPQQGTGWTTDAPPIVAAKGIADDTAAGEREQQLAAREAAVEQREAERNPRAAAAPKPPPVPPRHATSRRASAPPPAAEPTAAAAAVEEAETATEPEAAPAPPPLPPRHFTRLTVPAGTTVTTEMTSAISSATAQVGDEVTSRVAADVYAGDRLAVPVGSQLRGTVTVAEGARRIGGQARLAIHFDKVELPDGTELPVDVTWDTAGRDETRRDAATIGGSAVGGAILGHVLSHGRHSGERTAEGAAIGAIIGSVIAARNNQGAEVELAPGAALDLELAEALHVIVED